MSNYEVVYKERGKYSQCYNTWEEVCRNLKITKRNNVACELSQSKSTAQMQGSMWSITIYYYSSWLSMEEA